jgi:WD40 repeat protein
MVMLLIPSLLYAGNLRFTPVEPHHNNVLAAKFTKDGARTISVDDSGVLIEWDFINKQIIRRIKAPISTSGTALSGDNTKAVFIAEDGRVVIYDLGLGKFQEVDFSIMRAKDKEQKAGCIAISYDGTTLFASDNTGGLYRSHDGKPFVPFALSGMSSSSEKFLSALAVSPDGKKLAIGGQGMIRIVDASNGEPVWLIPHDDISYSFTLAFSPDSSLITAGIPGVVSLNHSQKELAVWTVDGGRKRLAVISPDGIACAGGFSRDGKQALLAFSGDAKIYDLTTGKQLGNSFKATGKEFELYFQMDMSPDGKFILISGRSGLLKIYETARIMADKEPEEYAELESRTFKVEALAFSPDGASLLVSHEKVRPLVLDLKEQKMLERLEFLHEVNYFRFTDNGKKLLAIGPYFLGQWQWPLLTKLPELKFKTENRTSDVEIPSDGASGVALSNNELIGDGFYRLPVLQLLNLAAGTVTATFKLDNLKDRYSRYYDLTCVDFNAKTAVVLDNDGDRRDENGRLPNIGRLPNRALLYALTDATLLKTITSDVDKDLPFDCATMTFAGKPREFNADLKNGHHYNHLENNRFDILSEDGNITVTDKKDGSTRRFATSGTNFTSWETGNHVITMALSPDGSTLAVGTNKGDVGVYDIKREKWLGTFLYLAYKEWVWYTAKGIVNASKNGRELVRKLEEH